MFYDNLVGGGGVGRIGIIEDGDDIAEREVVGDQGVIGVARKIVEDAY